MARIYEGLISGQSWLVKVERLSLPTPPGIETPGYDTKPAEAGCFWLSTCSRIILTG